MISLSVVVIHVLVYSAAKVALPDRDDLAQTLRLNRAHKALRVGIQIRASTWESHAPNSRGLEDRPKVLREQRVAIMDEEMRSAEKTGLAVGQVARDLTHPGCVGGGNNSGDFHLARFEIDYEEREVSDQPPPCNDLDREKVGRRDGAPMRVQE